MTSTADMPFFPRMGAYSAAACFADFITFPLDVAKVRLQVQGESAKAASRDKLPVYRGMPGTIATIVRNEGFRSLYNGLAAGLQRQLCFSGIRFGLYDSVKDFYLRTLYRTSTWPFGGKEPPTQMVITPHTIFPTAEGGPDSLNVLIRIAAGLTTGGICVLCAQPTDVVKIRFQAAARGSDAHVYRSTRDAYKTIFRQEGLPGLWKGTIANAVRNSIVNVGEIVVYDTVKEMFLTKGLMKDNIYCHFTTAAIAGFCATLVASPVDVIKTRYMNSKGQYRGALDCAIRTYKMEGLTAFYKGFVPSFCRIASWNIVLWLTFEQLKILIHDYRRKYN